MQGGIIQEKNVWPSICPSVHPWHAWIETKWKKLMPIFLYHMKDFYTIWKIDHPRFPARRMVGGARHLNWKLRPNSNWPCTCKKTPIFNWSSFV